ncbi:MAG: acyl-CoA thioesterase [Flavobacteriales bacterium]|nr:acyl-CoA thioesterase [Flavobacteriales bacterium]
MINVNNSIRVRYAETDQMKYVYHGNYAQYLEVARVELFRSIGLSYKEIEEKGCLLPVSKFSIHYKKPAMYDDVLTIHTKVSEIPTVKIHFDYTIYNQNEELLSIAQTTLFFMKLSTKKVIKCPDFIMEKILPFF